MQNTNPFRDAMQVEQDIYSSRTSSTNPQAQSYPPDSKDEPFAEDSSPPIHSNASGYANYQEASRALPAVNPELAYHPPPSYSYEPPPNPPPAQIPYYPPQQSPSGLPISSPPVVDQRSPGQSTRPSSSSSTSGFLSKLNPRDPLNPPPVSFSRPLPPHLHQNPPGTVMSASAPFPPMRLFSQGETIDKGFPIILPACSVPIHPFSQRDVQEGDWTRFLEDLQIRGRLTGGERIMSNALPLALSVGFVGGLFVTRGIENNMKRKKNGPVGELVDIWNDHFFHTRRLHVILAHGRENVSGDVDGPAPDYHGHGHGNRSRSRSYSCSSSSSSSDDQHGRHDRHSRKQERRERRAERRADKRERRQERRERRNAKKQLKHERYRLVIVGI